MGDIVESKKSPFLDRIWWVKYIPIILAFGYVPLIVRGCFYTRPVLSEQVWFSNGTLFDFFLLYKSIAIVACGALSLACLLIFAPDKIKPKNMGKNWYVLGGYLFFVLISGLFSQYKSLVIKGSYEMMEGIFVIISYALLAYAACVFVSTDGERGVKLVIKASLPAIIIISAIGFFQYFHIDFLKTKIGLAIIAGDEMLKALGGIATDGDNPVFSTLYNADYAGTYYVMMALMIISAGNSSKKSSHRRFALIAGVLLIVVAILTKVLTVYIAIGFAFFIFVTLWSLREEYWALPAVICVLIVVLAGFFVVNPDGRFDRIKEEVGLSNRHTRVVTSVSTRFHLIDFELNDGPFSLMVEAPKTGDILSNIEFKGKVGSKYLEGQRFDTEDGMFYVYTNIHGKTSCQVDKITTQSNADKAYFSVAFNGGEKTIPVALNFVYDRNSGYCSFVNELGAEIDFPPTPQKAEVFPDALFNNRGSIWNLTIPTLSGHIIKGSGANTFIMVYPQQDYIEEARLGMRLIDVKPHNFYLQQWSDNGLIALILLLAFVFSYWAKAAKFLTGEGKISPERRLAMGCILVVSVMFVSGITNDSNVCISPVFWIILGCGIGLNTRESRLQKVNEK